MNKELDFIRDKIAQSGVKAPDDMDEAYVIKTIDSPRSEAGDPRLINGASLQGDGQKQGTPKKKRRVFAAIAAAVVLVGAIAVALSVYIGNRELNSVILPGGLSLIRFRNHHEVTSTVKKIRKKIEKRDGIDIWGFIEEANGLIQGNYRSDGAESGSSKTGSASSSGSSGAAEEISFSETYKQVEGVDEADIIKTDGRYIYSVDYGDYPNKIVIFSAKGKSSKKVAVIDPENDIVSTPDEAAVSLDEYFADYYSKISSIEEIYLKDSKLIAVCSSCGDDGDIVTKVCVYDVGDINNITCLDVMTQSGSYSSSRMIGDVMYTVSFYSTYNNDIIPFCGEGDSPAEVPADNCYCLCDPNDDSFLVVSAYDTVDYSDQTESKAILGSVDDIYCNEDNMYIYTTDWDYGDSEGNWYDDILDFSGNSGVDRTKLKTHILKLSLTDGLNFTAYAEIEGQVNDRYSFDENDGNLRVATTSSVKGISKNNLYVLDSGLSVIGKSSDFAPREEIKIVRYVGDTAYVITYEQTDPLFVIDLSIPTSPEILGSVEISGFSSMLVPIDENTILGIGTHIETDPDSRETETGLKLALFDVSDKADPKVLDSKYYVDCFSEVMYNPRALVYNPDRGDFLIPLNYSHYEWQENSVDHGTIDAESDYYDGYVSCGGMIDFRVDKGKIVEIDRYKADYSQTERCVYVRDTIYMTYYDENGDLAVDSIPYKD